MDAFIPFKPDPYENAAAIKAIEEIVRYNKTESFGYRYAEIMRVGIHLAIADGNTIAVNVSFNYKPYKPVPFLAFLPPAFHHSGYLNPKDVFFFLYPYVRTRILKDESLSQITTPLD